MLYLIGLGLGDPSDLTLKGLEIIKKCERVYLESYTSLLCCDGKAGLVSRAE
jgi:diphthine synthase